jgi:hypothetical protein
MVLRGHVASTRIIVSDLQTCGSLMPEKGFSQQGIVGMIDPGLPHWIGTGRRA